MPKTTEKAPKASRPAMPRSYGIASGAKGRLDWQWAVEQLEKARNYWIVSVRPDGRPHAMPVWGVYYDGTVYFSTAPDSRKGQNLAANPAVVVHLESGDEMVVLEGTAVKLSEPADFERFDDHYAAKYGGIRPVRDMGLANATVYRLEPTVGFGWSEGSFPNSATRWVFKRAG